jgi:hypothetical protein
MKVENNCPEGYVNSCFLWLSEMHDEVRMARICCPLSRTSFINENKNSIEFKWFFEDYLFWEKDTSNFDKRWIIFKFCFAFLYASNWSSSLVWYFFNLRQRFSVLWLRSAGCAESQAHQNKRHIRLSDVF